MTDTCLATAVKYMDMVAKVMANFNKQNTRLKKQNNTGNSKSGKKGLFGPIIHRLVEAGGGNKSALSCSGQEQQTNIETAESKLLVIDI